MATGTNPAIRLLDDTDEPAGARVRRVGGLTFWAETLAFRTMAAREFIDVTDQVAGVLRRSHVTQGWVSVFSKHTTAAVVLNENEPLLLEDMGAMLERLSAAAGLAARISRSAMDGWISAAGNASSCSSSTGHVTASWSSRSSAPDAVT